MNHDEQYERRKQRNKRTYRNAYTNTNMKQKESFHASTFGLGFRDLKNNFIILQTTGTSSIPIGALRIQGSSAVYRSNDMRSENSAKAV